MEIHHIWRGKLPGPQNLLLHRQNTKKLEGRAALGARRLRILGTKNCDNVAMRDVSRAATEDRERDLDGLGGMTG